MDISGSFVLSIKDKKLNFKDIEGNLPIKPTKIIRKGQMIGKTKNNEAPYDIWSYEVTIEDSENVFNELSTLLEDLLPYSEYIKEVSSNFESITINCYLRSNYGQIGFQMNNEIILKLGQIGVSLDFHILSFGAVKD